MTSGESGLHRAENASPVLVSSETFEVFFRRTYGLMVSYAWALGGVWSWAEDVTMEAYEAAMKNWSEVRSYASPDAWLRRVIANKNVSRYRRHLSERRALTKLTNDRSVLSVDLGDSMGTLEAVRRLPRRQAQAVVLHHLLGLSRAETADEMAVSEETVKTHLTRARTTLARELGVDDES